MGIHASNERLSKSLIVIDASVPRISYDQTQWTFFLDAINPFLTEVSVKEWLINYLSPAGLRMSGWGGKTWKLAEKCQSTSCRAVWKMRWRSKFLVKRSDTRRHEKPSSSLDPPNSPDLSIFNIKLVELFLTFSAHQPLYENLNISQNFLNNFKSFSDPTFSQSCDCIQYLLLDKTHFKWSHHQTDVKQKVKWIFLRLL